MPRGTPRTNQDLSSFAAFGGIAAIASFAQQLGESLGQGIARGLSNGLTNSMVVPGIIQPRRGPGRPPKATFSGAVPADRRCKVDGCQNESRSKGLCSKHYQAERRRILAKA